MAAAKKKKRRRTSDRVTLEDIAQKCNVSKATVSRVLNDHLNEFPVSEEMIQRVKSAADELDYRPNRLARAIRSQRTHLIGLSCIHIDSKDLTPDAEADDNLNLGQFTNMILSHPDFKEYDLVIHDRLETPDRPLRPSDFKTDLLDGLIYLTPSNDHTEFLDVASKAFPVVLLGQLAAAEEKMPCIDMNNRKMARLATEHLIGLGRKNILMLIPEKMRHISCIQDRLKGYRDALSKNGIEVRDGLVHSVRSLKGHVNDFFADLSGFGEIDAVFCATDDLAAFCIAPLKARGRRIPEDIALMGFNDSLICEHTSPPLSSVRRPVKEQAHAAVDLLLKILKKEIPYEPGFHEIQTEVVIRESTDGNR